MTPPGRFDPKVKVMELVVCEPMDAATPHAVMFVISVPFPIAEALVKVTVFPPSAGPLSWKKLNGSSYAPISTVPNKMRGRPSKSVPGGAKNPIPASTHGDDPRSL